MLLAMSAQETVKNIPFGDEIAISGIAGKFPSSQNVKQYRDNLMNGTDMVAKIDRWDVRHQEALSRIGVIPNMAKYDPGYFGVHHLQVNKMCPLFRNIHEKVYEALTDAGINPAEMVGSKTNIYSAVCYSEAEMWVYQDTENRKLLGTGVLKTALADRVAYFLKCNGETANLDSGCSSSLYAVEEAYKALKAGRCDCAIVATGNTLFHPLMTLQFARLGMLNPDGRCKSFDDSADGYVRSEAVCVFILQKARDARRIYAEVVYAKTNNDGYKEEGITFPSSQMQRRLLEDFYKECKVDPSTVCFVEAHGTGTKVGDPVEIDAIDKVFTKNRRKPLLVGSVKSSVGHCEGAAGLVSLTKVIIALQEGYIPPNIYYNKPRRGMDALIEGRLAVITEKTPLPQHKNILLGVNSYGFGGANGHVLLRSYDNDQRKNLPSYYKPHMIHVSARTEEGVASIIDDVNMIKLNVEYINLINAAFRYNIPSHRYRGYTVLTTDGRISRSTCFLNEMRRPLCLCFTHIGSEWINLARDLYALSSFAASVNSIHDVLLANGLDVLGTIFNDAKCALNRISNFIGNLVTHIAIGELFKHLQLEPDYLHGVSVGILAASYLDGILTLKQAIQIARLCELTMHTAIMATDNIQGNGNTSHSDTNCIEHRRTSALTATTTKEGDTIMSYLKSLSLDLKTTESKLLVLKNANVSSKYNYIGYLMNTLMEFPVPGLDLGDLCDNAIICQVGKCEIFKDVNPQQFIYLNSGGDTDGVLQFLDTLGRLYINGYNFDAGKLYGDKLFPVSTKTPMISHLIRWNHDTNWHIPIFNSRTKESAYGHHFTISLEGEYACMEGNKINNKILLPATGYIFLVWKAISASQDIQSEPNVVFENIKFVRATQLAENRRVHLEVTIRKSDGYFEIMDGESTVVTGWVSKGNTEDSLLIYNETRFMNNTSLPMDKSDFYKEMRLRGYNYGGIFQSVKQYDRITGSGLVQWQGNWIAFMDNMIQANTLQINSRNLSVLTSIGKITICSKLHLEYVEKLKDHDYLVPIQLNSETQTIRCGGIEVKNPQLTVINRQEPLSEPVLEKYVFVPNFTHLKIEESVRVNIQIILENNSLFMDFKSVELFEEGMKEEELLSPLISKAIADQPLIKGNVIVLSKRPLVVQDAIVKHGKLSEENGCLLVTAKDILSGKQHLHQCLKTLKVEYILSREPLNRNCTIHNNLEILTIHTSDKEKLYLLRRKRNLTKATEVKIDNDNFSWLPGLKQAIKSSKKVIMYAQNQPFSGIVGLYNCIRREPNNGEVRCFFIDDQAPSFNTRDDFYKNQLEKDLSVNVYKNGKWGTYRHLPFNQNTVNRQHCFVNIASKGDLSSLAWTEGPLTTNCKEYDNLTLVHVYCAALNPQDIMIATGKLLFGFEKKPCPEQQMIQGFEYSGRLPSGKRVMGMSVGALSTIFLADRFLMAEIPDEWSLEDAATVMVVYSTVLFAFKMKVNIKRGQSILIHAGSGGIGQAAIRVALYHGLHVYTTVGTLEKREFLKQQFSELEVAHIGYSRDTSFKKLILKETNGRGVDYVLNSLSEDKLQASIRCVAKGGHYLEIGKCGFPGDTPLGLKFFATDAVFHAITLEEVVHVQPIYKQKILDLVKTGIADGYVKPLSRKVFNKDKVANAFKYMIGNNRTKKVLIRIKKEEPSKKAVPLAPLCCGIPRYFCDESMSYIVTGGLGGIGMELADWLVLRGARNLVLSTRHLIRNGYQASKIRIWRSYGVNVVISDVDITIKKGCVELVEAAKSLGPVAAVFSLAVVLKDAMLENQTEEKFRIPFGPKVFATKHLDDVTRMLCPNLRDFVVFSSISGGRGYAGVANYGMSNSAVERICEKRKADGLPALAIQWGAVGEVGIVAVMQENEKEVVIGGTLEQKLSSCFDVLDKFLRQPYPVVSSMIVAEKYGNLGSNGSITEGVKRILGVRDLKSVGIATTFAELGMDSMMAVEIQKLLQNEYGVNLSLQEVRGLTFEKLQTLPHADQKQNKEKQENTNMYFNKLWSEETFYRPIIELESAADKNNNCPKVFMIPGIDDSLEMFTKLARQLTGRTIYLQYCTPNLGETVPEIGRMVYETIKPMLTEHEKPILVVYSFGVLIALEVISLLEKHGHKADVIVVDGGTQFIDKLLQETFYDMDKNTINIQKVANILKSMLIPAENSEELKNKLTSCCTLNHVTELLHSTCSNNMYKKEFLKDVIEGFHAKILAFGKYKKSPRQFQSNFVLCRPCQIADPDKQENYELSNCTAKPVRTILIDCDHQNILEHPDVVKNINELICKFA